MANNDKGLVAEAMEAFRRKEIEPIWDELDRPDESVLPNLHAALESAGWGRLGLPEPLGGMDADAESRYEALAAVGAGSPALAMSLATHWTATTRLLLSAPVDSWSAEIQEALSDAWFALGDSLLDPTATPEVAARPEEAGWRLDGSMRLANPAAGWVALAVADADGAKKLAALPINADGVSFQPQERSHGCGLIRFGTLALDNVRIAPNAIGPYPNDRQSHRLADGMVAAIYAGMLGETAKRGMAYALERWQGGKMIYRHDAIQRMFGRMIVARDANRAIAIRQMEGDNEIAIGAASALAAESAWPSGLDGIQSFGGYGYMEDFRVERYLRDANAIDAFWIGAQTTRLRIAAQRFAEMGPKEETR